MMKFASWYPASTPPSVQKSTRLLTGKDASALERVRIAYGEDIPLTGRFVRTEPLAPAAGADENELDGHEELPFGSSS